MRRFTETINELKPMDLLMVGSPSTRWGQEDNRLDHFLDKQLGGSFQRDVQTALPHPTSNHTLILLD